MSAIEQHVSPGGRLAPTTLLVTAGPVPAPGAYTEAESGPTVRQGAQPHDVIEGRAGPRPAGSPLDTGPR